MTVFGHLKNDEGLYPWQSVNWFFGLLYFAGLPMAHFLLDGDVRLSLISGALGASFLIFFALVTWWLNV